MGNRRPKVLVVEDDDTIALGIHRALYRGNARFDVLVANSAEIGRAIMRELMVDVLITDVHLPGMSGLDLACWAAVESPETQLVLITGSDVSTIREQARALGCLRLVGKPFEPAELRPLVQEALECRERLRGTLSALSAADLIQMLCLGQKTTALRITANGVSGFVMVRDGRLIHASWGNHTGANAVYQIVAVEDGVFSMSPLPASVPVTIGRDWQHVLMEAARRLDERSKEHGDAPASRPYVRADDATLGEVVADEGWQLEAADGPVMSVRGEALYRESLRSAADPVVAAARLMDGGFAALRAGNIEHARRCWQAAQRLDPDNRSIELNLRKLESLSPRARTTDQPNANPHSPENPHSPANPLSPENPPDFPVLQSSDPPDPDQLDGDSDHPNPPKTRPSRSRPPASKPRTNDSRTNDLRTNVQSGGVDGRKGT